MFKVRIAESLVKVLDKITNSKAFVLMLIIEYDLEKLIIGLDEKDNSITSSKAFYQTSK